MGREEVKIAIFPSSLTHLLYVQVSGPFLVPYLSENDHFRIPPNTLPFAPKALSTLPRCPRNASIDSRPHYRFNAFSTVLTRTSENAPVIFSVTVFIFDTFSIVHTITNVCVFVLITFKSVFKLIRFKRKHISTLCSNFIQNFVRGRGVGGKQSVLWGFENKEYAP